MSVQWSVTDGTTTITLRPLHDEAQESIALTNQGVRNAGASASFLIGDDTIVPSTLDLVVLVGDSSSLVSTISDVVTLEGVCAAATSITLESGGYVRTRAVSGYRTFQHVSNRGHMIVLRIGFVPVSGFWSTATTENVTADNTNITADSTLITADAA